MPTMNQGRLELSAPRPGRVPRVDGIPNTVHSWVPTGRPIRPARYRLKVSQERLHAARRARRGSRWPRLSVAWRSSDNGTTVASGGMSASGRIRGSAASACSPTNGLEIKLNPHQPILVREINIIHTTPNHHHHKPIQPKHFSS